MRVAFVTQWFPPEPGEVPWNMATALRDFGHDVHVLTGWPNYPSGRLATGYPRAPYGRSACQGMTIHRVAEIPGRKPTLPSRLINYGSFAANATVATAVMPPMDAWLVYHSPATAALPAMAASVLSRLGRRPSAMAQVIQDLWPDSVTESEFIPTGKVQSAIARALQRFCDASYAASDAIGVISPGMRDILLARGVPDHKLLYTPNWSNEPALGLHDEPNRDQLGLPPGRLLLYAGNLGNLQNLERLASLMPHIPKLHLVFMGSGIAQSDLQRISANIPNVHLKDPVPRTQVSAYLHSADGLVVSLKNTPLLRATMPSKAQSSLAAGRPLIAHAAGDVAHLVERNSCGVVVDPDDDGRAVEALRRFAEASEDEVAKYGHNARKTYAREFTPEVAGDRLERLMYTAIENFGKGKGPNKA